MTTTTPRPAGPEGIGQTVRSESQRSPLRDFLRTETGSAVALIVASVAALVWANVSPGSYEHFWETSLSVHLGTAGVDLELREWVNSGLMAAFFFVVGLEARREFDMCPRTHLSAPPSTKLCAPLLRLRRCPVRWPGGGS